MIDLPDTVPTRGDREDQDPMYHQTATLKYKVKCPT